jgi:chloramphenicol-sensitive protein RarD
LLGQTLISRDRIIGILAALGAFGIWGVVPIFFKMLASVDAGVVIAHRIVWSLLIISVWQAIRYRRALWSALKVPPRTIMALLISGVLVAINWLTFVWAVTHDQVLSTSLGYFINPLVSVLLGMIFLGERLKMSGWIAVALAATSTAYLGWSIGEPPWVALILAITFGTYGLVRKVCAAGPLTGLWWETLWLLTPALWYLHVQDGVGLNVFAPYDASTGMLLVLSGLVTLVPLALFAQAARQLPLSTVGFFQYLAPSISFMLAIFVYHEAFGREQAVAFSGIWIALLVFALGPRMRRGKALPEARQGMDRRMGPR